MAGSHIVIVGGGFAGLYTALELEKQLKHERNVTVTLLNSENFFLFTPMLPEAGAGSLGTRHIVSPLRKLLRRTRFAEVEVSGIDFDLQTISARHSLTGAWREFHYDYLVLALGGVTNYFGIPGAADFTMSFKSLGDAIYVRNHTIDKLEEAAVEPERADELLTFAVVGGGLTGVEVVGQINDFVREAVEYYPEIDPKKIRVLLIEAGPRLMAEMNEKLAVFSEKVLRKRGVEVHINTSVVSVDQHSFTLSNGERVATHSLIWGAGVAPNPLIANFDLPKERGRIKVNDYLEVEGHSKIWALGDCAYILNPKTGKPHPATAQHAVREGKRAARNVAAHFGHSKRQVFAYDTMGQMAIVGERTGVADVMGWPFSGFIAWWIWRTYYLLRVPQLEKRLRVVLDWTLDLFFTRDIVQLAVSRERHLVAKATPVYPAPREK